jgi:ParB family transcriptional regulator, chromosome partitioning protein
MILDRSPGKVDAVGYECMATGVGRARGRKAISEAARPAGKTEPFNIQQVPLSEIGESGRNPRKQLGDMDELVASVDAYGLLQPIVLRRKGRHYELIAGHRRLEAMRRLGWANAPAIVRSAGSDEDAFILLLVENLQRSDLRPAEESAALEALVRERGWSTRQVAAAIGRSQAYVSKRLRVFEDPLLAPAVLANQLSVSAAEELLTLEESIRYELLSLAVEQHWDRQHVRDATRQRFAANRGEARSPGLTRRIHDIRMELRDVASEHLTEADRRELRLLFAELSMLARAPTSRRRRVFPPLPAS